MKRILLIVSLLTLVFCSMSFAQFEDVMDGEKNAFYETLTGPEDGHIFIPHEAFIAANGDMPDDDNDLSALVWTGWDDMYIYCYVEVKDDNVQLSNATDWANDSVEWKMDPDPTMGATSGICAINMTALGEEDAGDLTSGWSNLDADDNWPGPLTPEDDYARVRTDVGYNLEFRLAIEQIKIDADGRSLVPEVGSILGVAINVHDNDEVSGGRDGSIQWSATIDDAAWSNPQLLGYAELLEDHKLSFVTENFITGAYNDNPDMYIPPATQAVKDQIGNVADGFALKQNYPNPFNPSTTISYSLQKQSEVKISVYDLLGHEVAVLVDGVQTAGNHDVQFDGANLASGMYFYKLQTAGQVFTRKMTLIK